MNLTMIMTMTKVTKVMKMKNKETKLLLMILFSMFAVVIALIKAIIKQKDILNKSEEAIIQEYFNILKDIQ